MGLIARGLEMAGVPTVITSWNGGRTRVTGPPRATFTKLKRGSTMGAPHDKAQQRRILETTLTLLAEASPLKPINLNETME